MGHYIPSTREEQREMLNAIGVESVAAFFADVPESVLLKEPLNLPAGKSELEVRREVSALYSIHRKIYYLERRICDRIYTVSGGNEPGDSAVYF